MNCYLIIRIKTTAGEEDAPIQWVRTDHNGVLQHTPCEGDWPVLKQWINDLPASQQDAFSDNILLLLPGTLVTLYRLPINASQQKHLDKVIPFLVEENLAADVEAFHFSYRISGTDQVDVAVAPVKLIEELIEALSDINLDPAMIIAEDQLFLSHSTHDYPTLYIENRYIHTCFSKKIGIKTLDVDGLLLTINSLLPSPVEQDTDNESNPQIALYSIKNDSTKRLKTALKKTHPQICIHENTMNQNDSFLPLLAQEFSNILKKRRIINFRTGKFTCNRRTKKLWKKWKFVSIILCVWLIAGITLDIGTAVFYYYKAKKLEQQTMEMYKKTFPQDRSIVNVTTSLQRKLRVLQGTAKKNEFLYIVKSLPLVTNKNLSPGALEYSENDHRLIMTIIASSNEHLNNYIELLRKAGLSISLSGTKKETKHITAKLTITR